MKADFSVRFSLFGELRPYQPPEGGAVVFGALGRAYPGLDTQHVNFPEAPAPCPVAASLALSCGLTGTLTVENPPQLEAALGLSFGLTGVLKQAARLRAELSLRASLNRPRLWTYYARVDALSFEQWGTCAVPAGLAVDFPGQINASSATELRLFAEPWTIDFGLWGGLRTQFPRANLTLEARLTGNLRADYFVAHFSIGSELVAEKLTTSYFSAKLDLARFSLWALGVNVDTGLKNGLNSPNLIFPTQQGIPTNHERRLMHRVGAQLSRSIPARYQDSTPVHRALFSPFNESLWLDVTVCGRYARGLATDSVDYSPGWVSLTPNDVGRCAQYGAFEVQHNPTFTDVYRYLIPVDKGEPLNSWRVDEWSSPYYPCPPTYLAPHFAQVAFNGSAVDYDPRTIFDACPIVRPRRTRRHDTMFWGGWDIAAPANRQVCLLWNPNISKPNTDLPPNPRPPVIPGGGDTVEIPALRFYLMFHEVDLVRTSDGVRIPFSSLTFDTYAGSFAWGVSGTLLGGALTVGAITDESNNGVSLTATVNDVSFVFKVSKWAQSKDFDGENVSVTGHGLTIELTHPTLARSYIEDAVRNLPQLAMQELDDFRVNLPDGWSEGSFTWGAMLGATASIDPGVWSYSNLTPADAIQSLAEQVGCVVVPSRDSREVSIIERYPVAPWNYDGAVPNVIVRGGYYSIEEQSPGLVQADAVYVYGGETSGRAYRVVVSGEGGAVTGSDAQSNLIVDSEIGMMRGVRELAAGWTKPLVRSIALPFDNEVFPLPELGNLVQVSGTFGDSRGTLSKLTLTVSADSKGTLDVRQSWAFTDGEESVLSRFRRLIPADPLLIGKVLSAYGDGTCKVEYFGGGLARVKGVATVGASVYVQSRRIIGDAPSLPVVELSV